MNALDFHLLKLTDERQVLAARIAALAAENGRDVEIEAYLIMIERLNRAAIERALTAPEMRYATMC